MNLKLATTIRTIFNQYGVEEILKASRDMMHYIIDTSVEADAGVAELFKLERAARKVNEAIEILEEKSGAAQPGGGGE